MSTILAIETSTLRASVAVLRDNLVLSSTMGGVNTHSEEIIGLIDNSLKEAGITLKNLSHLAVGAGPGSFTGLRIGMATMKGLAFALEIPLVDVSSLWAVASEMFQAQHNPGAIFATILDARRDEIFVAFYRADGGRCDVIAEEEVMPPEDLQQRIQEINTDNAPLYIAGNGLDKFPELKTLGHVMEEIDGTPNAISIARLAMTKEINTDWQTLGPTYIRKSEAEIKFPNGNTGGAFSPPKS